MKLKVCGMREENNILEVSALGIDYMGFIFYQKSPRYVGQAFKMPLIPSSVKKVGVFVNETTETIKHKVQIHGLDYVQLHGDEPVEQCKALRQHSLSVIKAFSLDDAFDFKRIEPYKKAIDFFLFDTKGRYYGGNATAFNWDILDKYDQEVPFFLSGGIGPDNISAVKKLKGMNLHALDINSGVEVIAGVKDIQKISAVKQLITNITQKL